jgi:toxin ParE1/3/4
MARVYRTALAKSDLLSLWRRVAEDGHSPLNAERFLWKLDTHCQNLAEVPFMGIARPDIAPDIRSFSTAPYTIYYRLVSDGVEIMRVIHQARALQNVLTDLS